MIRLNCFIQVTEETRTAVLAAAKALTEASQKEAGCVSYDIFESATRPDVLMFCETWADAEALEAHSKSETFAKYVGEIKALAKLKLEKFEM
ncbi:MAG: putative quinol monooxygenase [Alloprevotella sp.]|nr:antibiotic biosynthesis monooxygenase [Bacteroidales bacterium]MDY3943471.1 putative quinol monooxygenase [Alloprevotella sp.]